MAQDTTITVDNATNTVYGNNDGDNYSTYSETPSNNTVTIQGGTVDYVYGAFVHSAPAGTDVSGNTINIHGGTVKNVYGGCIYTLSSGNVSGNTINIYGGSVNLVWSGKPAGGKSFNNIVNIFVGGTISTLIGGTGVIHDGDIGETLNVAAKGVTTNTLMGFKYMNFFLPADTAAGDTMLKVEPGETLDLTKTIFGVAAQSGLNLNVGDKVNLITSTKGINTADTLQVNTNITVPTGISTDTTYGFSIEKADANTITTTVTSKSSTGGEGDNGSGGNGGGGNSNTLPERTKSLTETRAGMSSFLNSGTDFFLSQGMAQADIAASENTSSANSELVSISGHIFTPFAAIGGSSLKVKSGSHVDSKALGINLGFAKKIANRQGTLLVGPIFEYGHGKYDSYLDSGVHGWGNSTFYGGGLFAKQTNHDGLYFEGSLRGGRVKADYTGNLATGLTANYDTNSNYFAAHLGIGKVFTMRNNDNIDVYLKYLYSHTGSDDVNIRSNLNTETYRFDSVNSNRLRLGFRYTHPLNDKSKLYAGLAYQYEFDGEARATYNGLSTPSPSLKGSSGMAELGWQVKPGKDDRLTLDLGVNGWAGKQQGVTASLKVNWEF